MSRDLTVDRLPEPGASLEVVLLEDLRSGADAARGPRAPHRHDYHELLWTREGTGRHQIDGEPSPVEPSTLTLIARGQVHVFERARDLSGAVVRFGDELLPGDGGAARAEAGWLLRGRRARTVHVPPGEVVRLEAAIEALHAETRRTPDARTPDLQRHLLSVLLLWVERWHDAPGHPPADDGDERLRRRFAAVLERDFARHHDARHYADALGVPPQALARALGRTTGRATKEHVTDRRMLEAARLLRFTDLTVGEVAFRAGFDDPLYFSRAFRRRFGEAPGAYRARLRGP